MKTTLWTVVKKTTGYIIIGTCVIGGLNIVAGVVARVFTKD